jgi:hypothetical protein
MMESISPVKRELKLSSFSGEYILIACLPKNSLSLATKAEEAGADAVLICVDGDETSYPGHYGSYDLHDVYIKDILSTLSIPCGIMIGNSRQPTKEYWERIMENNFSFVEMYAHNMPVFLLEDERVKKIAAISTGYMIEQVRHICRMEEVDAIDIATTPPQLRGNMYSLLDYVTLCLIAEISKKPIFLRTQKKITRDEIIKIVKLGVKGIVVDPCILSGTDETYREEIESLSPRRDRAEKE